MTQEELEKLKIIVTDEAVEAVMDATVFGKYDKDEERRRIRQVLEVAAKHLIISEG